LDPNFGVAHQTLARLYEAKGMYEKSLEEAFWDAPDQLARFKKIYAQSGKDGIWRDTLEYLLDRAKTGDVRSFWISGLYARLGDKDKSFEWLNKALEDRSVGFTYLIADARWDNIRSDPRYDALLKRVGLRK
jgi:tetratricopeptide (TPR) repeat protein